MTQPNPFKALLYSRKFWLLTLDTLVSLGLYFAGKYAAPGLFEDIQTVILALQPAFVAIIVAIAWEDTRKQP
jgi:hypothetical protein